MRIFMIIVVAVISYLIGSINSSIIISRIVTGKDIRKSGSGNAGATNMLRTLGTKYAVITLIIDILKGIIAVLIGKLICGSDMMYPDTKADEMLNLAIPYIAGLFVVIGHSFPVFFGFKGGKGVATSLGVVMMLDWKTGLIVLITALVIMAITRHVSLGSIVAAFLFPVLEAIKMIRFGEWNTVQFVCVLILAVLIIARHHENIKRLLNGTENKLGSKKGA